MPCVFYSLYLYSYHHIWYDLEKALQMVQINEVNHTFPASSKRELDGKKKMKNLC